MSLNDTPSGERVHIGFFGKRNVGKSSLVNAVTGQELSVVSDIKGTTTDPVSKAMELLPLGAVVITDTAGYDDTGKLGEMRVRKTKQILNKTDIAVLVVDSTTGLSDSDNELIELFKIKNIPYVIAYNKSDIKNVPRGTNEISVSALNKHNIHELKEKIASLAVRETEKHIIGDLVQANNVIILVTPIDDSAPKGRLILPQQQTIR
ncbi:MAG: 50S ribosome-binding GTPase, partial [Ruminococcus sp.]|nr:50S ribosome-binding GTPase [Ruminococcus sp.]